jgi:hypothetical protein
MENFKCLKRLTTIMFPAAIYEIAETRLPGIYGE